MKYVESNGYKVPSLGFGTWKLTDQACTDAVLYALDTGYRHIDTAQIYLNESEVGQALKQHGTPRSDIFLTTKIWMDNVSPEKMGPSFEESLSKLQTDYVDMLLLHWPVPEVPLKDQLAALTAIKNSGKARQIGVSNYTVDLLKQCKAAGAPISNNQIEYHPYLCQNTVHEYARANGIFITAYSPLARGGILGEDTLQKLAKKYGKNEGQIALRWLIQQDGVCAIPKAASKNNIQNNFNIFDFELTQDEMKSIFALAHPDGRLINPDWAPAWDTHQSKAA